MAESQTNAYKNEKRDYQRSLTREALFVSSYIQIKYKSIYEEAARMYNGINEKYQQKPDLRKTNEFREWKNNIAAENNTPAVPVPRQKKYLYKRKMHPNIPIEIATAEMLNETPTESPRNPSSIEKQAAGQQLDKRLAGMTMRLSIPLMQTPAPPNPTHHPEGILSVASNETVMEEGDQVDVLAPSKSIPPMQTPTSPNSAEHPTGALAAAYNEIVNEERDQVGLLAPSIVDGISAETMEKIISELQNDPNISEIMDDVEKSFNTHEEIIGLTVDLPDLEDPLEDELMLW